jgi:hypothetical protein
MINDLPLYHSNLALVFKYPRKDHINVIKKNDMGQYSDTICSSNIDTICSDILIDAC